MKMLVLSLTGRCNFACQYCYAHHHPQEEMSMGTAVEAINLAAAAAGRFILQFSGGEPLLAFDLMRELIRYVRQRRLPAIMQVQTNGSLLSPQRVEFLRQARVGIGISLDGRPDVNDRLRRLSSGSGTCRQILNGAKHLAAQRVEIGITCVVAADNVENLSSVVEMAYYLGNVRRIGFDLLRRQGRGVQVAPATAEAVSRNVRKALQTIQDMARLSGRTMLVSQLERVESLARGNLGGFGHCYAMNDEAAFVDARGNIYACSSLVGDEEFKLGHVKTGIDGRRQETVVKRIQDSMRFCRACPSFALCGGGCFARWYGSGSGGSPYEAECALKQTCIKWYREHQRQEAGMV